MKSLRLISSLNLIYLCFILVSFSGCETNQETIKTTSVKPQPINKIQKQEVEKPVNIPVIKQDSITAPDTVETHDRVLQKKSEIKVIRRVLNFHRKPLIT
jgi:hypothetical protein